MPYSKTKAAMVQKTVTITLNSVVVEQPQPSALVLSSNRSFLSGQIPPFDTGSKSEDVGTHVELCTTSALTSFADHNRIIHMDTIHTHVCHASKMCSLVGASKHTDGHRELGSSSACFSIARAKSLVPAGQNR